MFVYKDKTKFRLRTNKYNYKDKSNLVYKENIKFCLRWIYKEDSNSVYKDKKFGL